MAGLFFDARYIRPDFHDGISRFSANLFAAVARVADVTAIISDESQLSKLPTGTKWVRIPAPTSALEPFASLILNRYKPEVVFSPMQTIGSLGRRFKLVLTIHDLIYYRHPAPPRSLPPLVRLGWRLYHLSYLPQRVLLRNCEAVACVSETTAEDLRQNRLTKKPLGIVYNAPEGAVHGQVVRSPKKTLVYMGSFMGYKNVETLIRGAGLLRGYRLQLLSPISPERKASLQRLAAESGAKVTFHEGVSDQEYAQLLDQATALVSGSLDEGFGIPVVEALSRGVPVVLSDIPIFHEVAGDCGEYFAATDEKDFAAAVRRVAKNPREAHELIAQAKRFNWDASAENLLALIRSL